MTPTEALAATAAILGLVIAALSALAAFRSAASARSAQRWAEEAARNGALFAVARTAAEILVDLRRIKSSAEYSALAHSTLGVFSGSYQNSGIQQSENKVAKLVEQAEELATPARLFSDTAAKLSQFPQEEITRVHLNLCASQGQVAALREELERTVASIEAENTQHRERALLSRP
jgi:hypothetical protein